MSAPSPEITVTEPAALPRWRKVLRWSENWIVIAALAVMTVVPVVVVLFRYLFAKISTEHFPTPFTDVVDNVAANAPTITQHLVLAVGMLGGALAARDNRLLSLSAVTTFLKGRTLIFAQVLSAGVAAAICACLARGAWTLTQVTHDLATKFAYGIPLWIVQLLLPVGFALIALRILWNASPKWRGRTTALLITLTILAVAWWSPVDPEKLRWPAIGLLLLAAMAGAPIFTVLGGAGVILLWSDGEGPAAVVLKHYTLVTNPTLPSIPLFTLAGYFLAESGASKRLVRVFEAFVGQMRGGPAIVTALACAFFTSFTGASGVTILALGAVLMPVLTAARYPERSALGLLTGAGSLGLLFPPCLPPILYSIIASSGGQTSVSIQEIFKGGLIPGLLLVGMTACWGVYLAPKSEAVERRHFNPREAFAAAWQAKWELLVPVVALTALFGGFATPVEAAAITAFYAFLVEVVVYRDLKLVKDIPRVMTECGLLIGGVLLILGVALGFTHYLVDAQIPEQAVAWATATIKSKWLFLLALNIALILIGGLVEIYAAIVVVVPLLVPIGIAFHIDPIHLGIIFLANMELGFLAPPVGLNLLLSSYRFNKPILQVARATLPMLLVLLIGVLLITYVPWLTTWLPGIWK